MLPLARKLREMGFKLIATRGTHKYLKEHGVESELVYKVTENLRPHIVDRMKSGDVSLVINTTWGKQSIEDSKSIRRTAINMGIPYFTTVEGAKAAVEALEALRRKPFTVRAIQDYYKEYNLKFYGNLKISHREVKR